MSVRPTAYAVIVAGGQGTRMGASLPKQFMELAGRPVLYYSIRAFLAALAGVQIVLVVPAEHMTLVKYVLDMFDPLTPIITVHGGATRYASVAAGLQAVPGDGIVLVHDGARPLVSPELIRRCYESAVNNGSAVPVVRVVESIRQVSGYTSRAIAREDLRSVQTPQAFEAGILHAAFRQPYIPSFTDEASVVEWTGQNIYLVEGARSNLKITAPEDLIIAEALLRSREGE
jgi:2-C-methyl-D-erythritol 4-phosphate cytidylyltransferase